MPEEKPIKQTWKPIYTWVLVANAVYIILFYIIMKSF